MKARPILFSAPMVRALLAGSKTQTRRIVKGVPSFDAEYEKQWRPHVLRPGGSLPNDWSWWEGPSHGPSLYHRAACPYGVPGDLLIVREAFKPVHSGDPSQGARYRADVGTDQTRWKPSIHMPYWASRLTLEITDVRVERLQDISYDDCRDEGTVCRIHGTTRHTACSGLRDGYRALWNSINGDDAWDANPWVWAVSFKVHHANVDAFLARAA